MKISCNIIIKTVLLLVGVLIVSLRCTESRSPKNTIRIGHSFNIPTPENIARMKPSGEVNHFLVRWIQNLLYDPLMRYEMDETEFSDDPDNAFSDWQIELKKEYFSQELSTCVANIPINEISLSNQKSFVPEQHLGKLLDDFDKTTMLQLGIHSIFIHPRHSFLVCEYQSTSDCKDILAGVILSQLRVYLLQNNGTYVGSGPYVIDYKNSKTKSSLNISESLVLTKNNAHTIIKTVPSRTLQFDYYENLSILEDAKIDKVDIKISESKLKKGDGFKEKVISVGDHYYAWINPSQISDIKQRRWLYQNVFRKSKDDILNKYLQGKTINLGEIQKLSILDNIFWFPTGWVYTDIIIRKRPELIRYSFNIIKESAQMTPLENDKLLRIALTKGIRRDDLFVDAVEANLIAKKFPDPHVYVQDKEFDPNPYDIVIIKAAFDIETGEPSQTLRSIAGQYLLKSPSVNAPLRRLPENILKFGSADSTVIEDMVEIQETLWNDAYLFPLFTVPIYIYYNPNRVAHPAFNYREGFVHLDKWNTETVARNNFHARKQ